MNESSIRHFTILYYCKVNILADHTYHTTTQKPLNYCENSNRDMLKIMEILQRQYLDLVCEQSSDKEAFKEDLRMMYLVGSEKDVREAAEERIKAAVKAAGVAILHGDLLTDVRFETCKRLRRMGVSAVERFDFLVYFRLGTFHMGMNKTIQGKSSKEGGNRISSVI